MDDLDWVVDQQRYVLENIGRVAREELRHEIGCLRQQLLRAEIREEFLSKSVQRRLDTEVGLVRQLVDAESRVLRSRAMTAVLEDEWMIEWQRQYHNLHKSREEGVERDSLYQEDLDDWMAEQQRLYKQLQSKQDPAPNPMGGFNEPVHTHHDSWEPPPSYQDCCDDSHYRIGQTERAERHEPQEERPVLTPQVRFVEPLEIITNPTPPPSPEKTMKDARKQVVHFCRKRNNRTVVWVQSLHHVVKKRVSQ